MPSPETYVLYLKLLPSLVRTVAGLAESVQRLATANGVDVPDVAELERLNQELLSLPDLETASDAEETRQSVTEKG